MALFTKLSVVDRIRMAICQGPKCMRGYKVVLSNKLGKSKTYKPYCVRYVNSCEEVQLYIAGAFDGNLIYVECRGPFGLFKKVIIDSIMIGE